MHVRLRHLLSAALVALCAAAPAVAQEVSGRVLDEASDAPVQSVVVALLDSAGQRVARTHSDDQGRFVLRVLVEGTYRVQAERMGYRSTLSGPVQAGGRVSVDMVLRLPTRELLMGPLTITAEREAIRVPWLDRQGFYDRREGGAGRFMDREEIAEHGARRMSVLVSRIPGVTYVSTVGTSLAAGDVSMQRSRGCLPSIWLDGILVRPGGRHHARLGGGSRVLSGAPGGPRGMTGRPHFLPMDPRVVTVDELVDVSDVEALEVYRGPSEVPPAFGGGSACGAVVVWTHTGPLARVSSTGGSTAAGPQGIAARR